MLTPSISWAALLLGFMLPMILASSEGGRLPFKFLPRGGAAKEVAAATIRGGGAVNTFIQTIMDARRHLVAAAVARSTSIFAMYPVDTIKTRIQMDQKNPFRLTGIYKGVDGSLMGQVPYGVLTFGSYEVYKNALLKRFPQTKPVFLYAVAAIFGDLTGSGLLCPSEVIKQQMQAGMYSSTTEALTQILKKQGLPGLYQGYLGGITRDVPFRVAQLTTYEVTKNCYLRFKKYRQTSKSKKSAFSEELELSPVEAAFWAICWFGGSNFAILFLYLFSQLVLVSISMYQFPSSGAASGTFSAGITSPLDRIKTLLMTDSAAYGGSVASCAAKIWKEEGLKGFTTGVVPRVVYIAPSVVIFFVAYEYMQQRLKHWQT